LGGKKAKIRAAVKSAIGAPIIENHHEEAKEIAAGEIEEDVNLAPQAEEILTQLLQKMGETCTIQGVQELDQISLIIEGEDAGLLIGKQGQTLEALQYLVTKILSKQTKKKPRVVIDIESYRERHKQSLIELALKQGAKAKRIGKPVTLNPMNAHDRRIVHLALQQDKAIKTKSRGEGLYKKIIIYPVKKKRAMEAVNELG
ncbi:MAG TPA: RNA-binding cell elongation regulator Jag/EloR, partial [Thermodesulfobacteriota bacterium]|nr:RNA-binding cell elongation regulator Jag/EloR [Thermodesulfobacteriota bacterium]